ncbi:MAG: 2-hydroxyacid dehydrogenase [Actinomycetota bacterium]|nr:2-hydroxyacid dehydrogenase [Actinomycetota bacterium]
MTVVAVANPQIAAALAGEPELDIVEVSMSADLPAAAAAAEVLIPGFLAGGAVGEAMAALPQLKLVQLMTAGAELWVGKTPPGVQLCTSRGAHGGATAEWAVGALLAVLHEFPQFVQRQAEGIWDRHETDELAGKRVLVLGAGDLGTQVKRRLEGFDARVTLAARTARDGVISIDQVPAVLGDHDVVIVMVPLTAATTGLVNAEFLAAMPDGAVLVNAARGQIVVTDALIAELTAGRLRATVDVTDPEPLPDGHPLWSTPNIFLTPHIAGAVPGSADRALAVVTENLRRFAAGEPLRNVVGENGY